MPTIIKMSIQLIAICIVCPLLVVLCLIFIRWLWKGRPKKWTPKKHSYPEEVNELLKCDDINFDPELN